jgi:hypothetical protein
MPDTLAIDLKAAVIWNFQEALDLSTVTDAARLEFSRGMADGLGADQADKVWHDARSVASGANDDLDLTALAVGLFGGSVTIAFAKVKALLIVNLSTTAGEELVLDGTAPNAFLGPLAGAAGKIEIGPDSALFLSSKKDGWTVTAGTGDVVRVRNPASAAPVNYKIVIVGTSA